MKIFEKTTWIPQPREVVFPFFASAHNLEQITPPWLNFKILSQSTPRVGEGTIFKYKLRVKGFPIRWTSRIEEWKENEKFVDLQVSGPYQLWHHTHLFIAENGGTRMSDIVRYQVPFGWLGNLVAGRLVAKDVAMIFNYRDRIIHEIYRS